MPIEARFENRETGVRKLPVVWDLFSVSGAFKGFASHGVIAIADNLKYHSYSFYSVCPTSCYAWRRRYDFSASAR